MNHYDVLGIAVDADAAAIKQAYRRLAMRLHPDRNPGNRHAEAAFKAINEAHAVLGNPERRAAYDRTLRTGSAHAGVRHEAGAAGPERARRETGAAAQASPRRQAGATSQAQSRREADVEALRQATRAARARMFAQIKADQARRQAEAAARARLDEECRAAQARAYAQAATTSRAGRHTTRGRVTAMAKKLSDAVIVGLVVFLAMDLLLTIAVGTATGGVDAALVGGCVFLGGLGIFVVLQRLFSRLGWAAGTK
ncbi:protein of unknown function [Rhodovastum atsumiense]|uniref:DnaJ domain-containing protein n=1 Tax=Rhodovastum atsumiense TaxID=504468 RepID=UPI00193AF081|nr:DnaJ domain-containing protein [Rhodovastum atsumiense]CAH2598571.1 protein of unknown function [Rhodovastum atsumiense]